jgi:hypothetical protein
MPDGIYATPSSSAAVNANINAAYQEGTDDPLDPVATSSVFGSANFNASALTPESLVVYLNTRMGSLDSQMNDIFERQKKSEKVRGEVRALQQQLTTLKDSTDKKEGLDMTDADAVKAFYKTADEHMAIICELDATLGEDIKAKYYSEGQIGAHPGDAPDAHYDTSEIEATKEYLDSVSKGLESSSQMDMINLQSLMGTRQTAVQLATNLISALNETSKSVVSNIRA